MVSDKREFWHEAFQVAGGLLILLFIWSAPIVWLSGATAKAVVGLPLAALVPTAIALEASSKASAHVVANLLALVGMGIMVLYPPIAGMVSAWGGA